MKRVFTIGLVVVMLMGVLSTNMLFNAQATLKKVGDINGDGKVNNRDLANLQQYLSDWDVQVEEADLNGDGKINNRDLGQLQQLLSDEELPTTDEKQTKASVATKYVSLGAPAESRYPNLYVARCALDMIIHDGRLYVGCGDYDKNPGDAPILSCPVDEPGNWTVEATIPDEHIGRFVDINGVLTIPGFDPVGSPKYGSYYELLDGEWVKQENLPDGLHNFDIAWFQGRMYAAIGAERGGYPIAYTEDGVTYQTLPLYKNGELVYTGNSDVVRCFNLYVLGDELYADFWYADETLQRSIYEMYHYNKEADCFEYVADIKNSTHGGLYGAAGIPLWEKKELGGKMFVTTGYLYYTTDFKTYTAITIPNSAVVYDMQVLDGRLYLLTAYEKDGKYQVTVYSTTADKPSDLRKEAEFTYALMPNSFAMDAENIFIGMGNWYKYGSNGNGTILQVKR